MWFRPRRCRRSSDFFRARRKGAPRGGAARVTIEEVVRRVLLDEHADVVGEAVKAVAAGLMELAVSELIGAERGERRLQDRANASQWPSGAARGHPRVEVFRRRAA